MTEFVPFGSTAYWILTIALLVARAADFVSTRIATPTLAMEANPLFRKLGWGWAIVINVVLCFALSLWLMVAVVMITVSLMVAARNFQSAWLMRGLGERKYAGMIAYAGDRAGRGLYAFSMLSQAGLVSIVGGAVVCFSWPRLIAASIGIGIIGYAVTVGFYSLLSMWQIRPPSDQPPMVDEEAGPRMSADGADSQASRQPEGSSETSE